MPGTRPRRLTAASALCIALCVGSAASARQVQPSYDVIRVDDGGGNGIPYVIWTRSLPVIVTTPDGGAWLFFSAQPADAWGAGDIGALYAARFDPASGVWLPAGRMPGGEIQFSPSAVVDAEGRVHVVYSDRKSPKQADVSTLVYTVSDGQGGWAEPVAIAPHEKAGHQLSAQLALDGGGGLHVIWQDQRNVTDEQRVANPVHADIFVSDLVGGQWSAPVQVAPRPEPETNGSRPQLVADGARLVAAWTIYERATDKALGSALRVEWSTRPLEPTAPWAEPKTLIEQDGTFIGGHLIDLASLPGGGVLAFYGRRIDDHTYQLFLRWLVSAQEAWSEEAMISVGEQGSYPALAVAQDGTAYAVFERGIPPQVDVGALAVAPGSSTSGPVTVASPGEVGGQGRPGVTVDQHGRVWIAYFHQPEEHSPTIEVRVLRGARVPTQAA